jgi:hypothetical protein
VVAGSDEIIRAARTIQAKSLTKSSPFSGMSNLVAWYESPMNESFETEVDEGFPIERWNNLSPTFKGNNALAPNSDQSPLYIKNAINGLPALEFQGDDATAGNRDFFSFNGTGLLNKNYTIFIVEKRTASGQSYLISGNPSGSQGALDIGYLTSNLMVFQHDNVVTNDAFIYSNNELVDSIPRIHTFQLSGSLGRRYFINGGEKVLTLAGGSGTATIESYANAQIGRNSDSNYFVGIMGEIIIFNKYLNDDDRREVEDYLSTKWKIN